MRRYDANRNGTPGINWVRLGTPGQHPDRRFYPEEFNLACALASPPITGRKKELARKVLVDGVGVSELAAQPETLSVTLLCRIVDEVWGQLNGRFGDPGLPLDDNEGRYTWPRRYRKVTDNLSGAVTS